MAIRIRAIATLTSYGVMAGLLAEKQEFKWVASGAAIFHPPPPTA